MALISGAEGDEKACIWLVKNHYEKLSLMAKGADNDDEAITQLLVNGHREWAMIALKMRAVKNDIQDDFDNWHTYSQR